MRYCLRYNQLSQYEKEVDELRVNIPPKFNMIFEFIKAHPNQTIIFNVRDVESELTSGGLAKLASEKIKLRIEKEDLSKFKAICISDNLTPKFLISTPATDWDTFIGYINEGVSDIYVAENLCFELDKVSALAKRHGVNIRIFPNIAQSSWYDTTGYLKFWVRPEDIEIYEKYVDVFEIYHRDYKYDDMIYRIYSKDGKWFGNLEEIIIDLDYPIDSRSLAPTFAPPRIKCGKKCQKIHEGCHKCHINITNMEILKERQIIFKEKV